MTSRSEVYNGIPTSYVSCNMHVHFGALLSFYQLPADCSTGYTSQKKKRVIQLIKLNNFISFKRGEACFEHLKPLQLTVRPILPELLMSNFSSRTLFLPSHRMFLWLFICSYFPPPKIHICTRTNMHTVGSTW